MRAFNKTGSFRHRGGKHARFTKYFQRDAPADNIDDGVDRADFMEMHIVCGHAVNFPFRASDPRENRIRFFFNPWRKRRLVDQVANLAIRAAMLVMFMLVRMRLTAMAMFVRMRMTMVMSV